MNLFTERILLSRIINKDRNAAEKLINDHYKKVYYFLFKLCKDKDTAQDLTQDTFIKVWEKINNFNGRSRFSTWLYRISYNVFIDNVRSKKTDHNFVNLSNPEVDQLQEICMEEEYSKSDFYQKLIKAINMLSGKLKETIIFHYEHNLSFSEISKILDIPKGTVKSRINAGLNELRRLMDE